MPLRLTVSQIVNLTLPEISSTFLILSINIHMRENKTHVKLFRAVQHEQILKRFLFKSNRLTG